MLGATGAQCKTAVGNLSVIGCEWRSGTAQRQDGNAAHLLEIHDVATLPADTCDLGSGDHVEAIATEAKNRDEVRYKARDVFIDIQVAAGPSGGFAWSAAVRTVAVAVKRRASPCGFRRFF